MNDPQVPEILTSLDGVSWSLAEQLARDRKRMTGSGKYLDLFKQGLSPSEIFAQEHDQIQQNEILKQVIPIAQESIDMGWSEEETLRAAGLPMDAQANANPQIPQVDIPSQKNWQLPADAMGGIGPSPYEIKNHDEAMSVAASRVAQANQEIADAKQKLGGYMDEYGKLIDAKPEMPGKSPIQKPDTVEALVTLAAMFANPSQFSGDIASALLNSKLEDQQVRTQEALKNFMILDEQHKQALTYMKDLVDKGMKALSDAQDAQGKAMTEQRLQGQADETVRHHNELMGYNRDRLAAEAAAADTKAKQTTINALLDAQDKGVAFANAQIDKFGNTPQVKQAIADWAKNRAEILKQAGIDIDPSAIVTAIEGQTLAQQKITDAPLEKLRDTALNGTLGVEQRNAAADEVEKRTGTRPPVTPETVKEQIARLNLQYLPKELQQKQLNMEADYGRIQRSNRGGSGGGSGGGAKEKAMTPNQVATFKEKLIELHDLNVQYRGARERILPKYEGTRAGKTLGDTVPGVKLSDFDPDIKPGSDADGPATYGQVHDYLETLTRLINSNIEKQNAYKNLLPKG